MSPKCIEARMHSTSLVLFGYCGRTIGLGGMFIGMQLRVAVEVKIDAKCIIFFLVALWWIIDDEAIFMHVKNLIRVQI